jgi:hypothetical protein
MVSIGVLAFSMLAGTTAAVPIATVDVQAIGTLDRAIDALSVSAADTRLVLRQVLDALKPAAESTATRGVEAVLERMPPETAFPCGTAFLRKRALKELVQLRGELLGDTPEPLEPEACYARPFAVDATQPPAAIEIYGADFDRVAVEMFLVTDAQFSDVSSGLTRRSSYHLTFDPKSIVAQLGSGSQFLGLTWEHLIHYSIPVVHPKSALCRPRVEQVTPPDSVEFALETRAGGGATSSRFRLRANMALEFKENGANASVCATAQATNPDGVTYSGCANRFLFTIDPDRTIDGILESTEDRIAFVASEKSKEVRHGKHDGPVRQWVFDTPQSTDGKPPQLSVALRTLHVVSSDNIGCVSPVAYAEAKRQHAIGTETMRALDGQFSQIPRAVRALRPLFSPGPE